MAATCWLGPSGGAHFSDFSVFYLPHPYFHTCIMQMEHCDRGSLVGSIRRGMFRGTDRWGRTTALRALVRTAKEVAQVRGVVGGGGRGEGCTTALRALVRTAKEVAQVRGGAGGGDPPACRQGLPYLHALNPTLDLPPCRACPTCMSSTPPLISLLAGPVVPARPQHHPW